MKLYFYSDPFHGWLKVPLNIFFQNTSEEFRDSISSFSYVSKNKNAVFLEEDRDANLFTWEIFSKTKEIDISVTEKHTNKSSKIRGYEKYSHEKAKQYYQF